MENLMSSEAQKKDLKLIWLVLEMTGLDIDTNTIIESAIIISDLQLQTMIEGPSIVIHTTEDRLNKMDAWNKKTHKKSNLWTKCIESKIDLKTAENTTLEFVSKHIKKGEGILAGNSVWQDAKFLSKYMPRLESYFNYRHIDVSSFKEVAVRWMNEAQVYEKKGSHRALGDIKESVEELKFYKKLFFPE